MLGAFNPPRLRTIPDIAPFTRSQRIANGPDLIRAGEAVRRAEKNRDAWPFVHVYPPVNSQRRNPTGFIQSPAIAAQAVVLAFSVPSGFWFYLQQLGLYYSGAPANPGDFLFTVDRNAPLGSPVQGSVLTDLNNVAFPFGSFLNGPVQLPRTELIAPTDLLQVKVTNVGAGVGTGTYFGAYFGGWLVPTIEVPDAQ
jgi:hypothetical protein